MNVPIKTPSEIEKMREAGRQAASVIEMITPHIQTGISTGEIDRLCHEYIVNELGSTPAPLNYHGFPTATCTSINHVVCHGIPNDKPLREGDIINLDVTAYKNGVHGDTNATYAVGEVDRETELLINRTRTAMERGIKAVKPGREVNVIGRVIEQYAKRFGYGVVRDYTCHGSGTEFHNGLIIPHYDAAPHYDDVIEVGMVFTVEPMLNLGSGDAAAVWSDGWTVVSRDGSRSAQFENTVVITEDGYEILTSTEA